MSCSGRVSVRMDLVVGNAIPVRYPQDSLQASLLEDIKPSRDLCCCLARFRRVECRWYDDAVEQVHLGLDGDRLGCTDGIESLEDCLGVPDPALNITFAVSIVGHDTAQVGELVNFLDLSSCHRGAVVASASISNSHDLRFACTYAESDLGRLLFQTLRHFLGVLFRCSD